MIKEFNLKNKLPHIISITILVILASLLMYRSLFGFDWSEETYYSSLAYLNLINRDILQNMQYLTFWPIILGPFVDLYRMIAGNFDGIILYLRILYNLFTLGLAIYLYKTAVKVVTPWVALLASAVLLIFVPIGIPSLSHNSIVIWMTILSMLLINNGITGNKISYIHILLSGFAFSIAVIVYPTMWIALLVIPIHLFIKSYHIDKLNLKWEWVIIWLLGLLVLPILLVLYILLNYTGVQITDHISRIFNNMSINNYGTNSGNIFINYYNGIQSVFPNKIIWFIIGAIAAFINTLFKKERLNYNEKLNNHERLTYVGTMILMIFFVIIEFLMFAIVISQNSYVYALVPLTLAMPMLYFMTNRFSSKYIDLYLLGIFLSFAMCLTTSDTTAYFAGFLLSTIAVILYVGEYLHKEDFDIKWKIPIYGIIFYFGFSILFSLGSSRVNLVYRDAPINNLKTQIEAGPGRGIYTTPESASKYAKIYEAIKKYVPENGTVLYSRLLPFGYLSNSAEPALPIVSSLDISSEYLNEYFSSTYYAAPDCVFVVADGYGYMNKDGSYSNDNNPIDGVLGRLLKSDAYKVIELDYATIYLKIK